MKKCKENASFSQVWKIQKLKIKERIMGNARNERNGQYEECKKCKEWKICAFIFVFVLFLLTAAASLPVQRHYANDTDNTILYFYIFIRLRPQRFAWTEKKQRITRYRRATCRPHITTSQTRFGRNCAHSNYVMQSFECSKGQSIPPRWTVHFVLC